jgi:hypothetical protein
MKFEEALTAMREGKKVRLPRWRKGCYVCIERNTFIDEDGIDFGGMLDNILDNDWEIYEEQEWEPKGGYWCIGGDGTIFPSTRSPAWSQFGSERSSKEQAEAARDKMRTFNRLLAYVDEHSDPAEECNAKIFHNGIWVWTTVPLGHQLPDTILMPKRVAEQLCKDLNSGRVVL